MEINASAPNLPVSSIDSHAADEQVRDHVAAKRPSATRNAYASDRRKWREYCTAFAVPDTLLTLATLTGFVEWLIQQHAAPKTVERRVSGVRLSLTAEGVPDLDGTDRSVVAERIAQYKRELAVSGERRGRGKARPIGLRELRAMSQALPDTLLGTRDRALLLVGFGMAARRSELAGLWAEDVEVCDEGLCLVLRSSKTSVEQVEVAIPYGTSAWTCPVTAWAAYRDAVQHALGADLEGKAFRRIDRHGRVLGAMSGQAVGIAFKRAAGAAGLSGERVTAHGLRAGLATEARRAGHDVRSIAEQGRWSPNGAAVHGYMHIVDRWEDNAVRGIGM